MSFNLKTNLAHINNGPKQFLFAVPRCFKQYFILCSINFCIEIVLGVIELDDFNGPIVLKMNKN
jgi:hypothetical protein